MIPLTLERLKELLHYDPETGRFIRRVATVRQKVGQEAGYLSHGYRSIRVDGRRYLGHRLAWFYVHGAWPSAEVDHRYGVRDDNRISELREATHAQNGRNAKLQSRNTSGRRGVCWNADRGKWQAMLHYCGKNYHLGLFTDLDEASAAYEAEAELRFGEFRRSA